MNQAWGKNGDIFRQTRVREFIFLYYFLELGEDGVQQHECEKKDEDVETRKKKVDPIPKGKFHGDSSVVGVYNNQFPPKQTEWDFWDEE
jgi:hypothetical protein